jgi:hypothetical protein
MSYNFEESIEMFKVNIIVYSTIIGIGLFCLDLPRRYYYIVEGIYKIIPII